MPLIVQALIILVIFLILKEVLKSASSAVVTILVILFIFFVVGGTMNDLKGGFGSASRFFSKLPTSQFLDLIVQFFKDALTAIRNAFGS